MNLFNKKLIRNKIANYVFPFENFDTYFEIISNWQKAINNTKLKDANEKNLQGTFFNEFFKTILKDKSELCLTNGTKKITEKIFDCADSILTNNDEYLDLEKKIVLSIAIRLKAEEFMIKAINDQSFVDSISKNQTIELISKYKVLFPNIIQNINLLEQVNLMTPENIHLNSFMYEPILDLGDKHLKDLYNKVKQIN